MEKHNLSTVRIPEEIRNQGYSGEYTILKDYCPVSERIARCRLYMWKLFSEYYK